jgi:hypothetical protein
MGLPLHSSQKFLLKQTHNLRLKFFVANAFISPFSTQTMHIKSFYTQ